MGSEWELIGCHPDRDIDARLQGRGTGGIKRVPAFVQVFFLCGRQSPDNSGAAAHQMALPE